MDDGLFDFSAPAVGPADRTALMTDTQRRTVRELFAKLGIVDARTQFEVVAELTGVRLASVAELERDTATRLIRLLTGRVARLDQANTGSAWSDRDEDTWIDRL